MPEEPIDPENPGDPYYYKDPADPVVPGPQSQVLRKAVYYEWSEEEQKWNLAFGMDIVDNREIPNGEFDGQLLAIEYEVD